jgi:hypothetical protein
MATTWLLDEDEALRDKLSGFTAPNYGQPPGPDTAKVAVYFRSPDPEIRKRTFPHIAIDLVNIAFDPTRAHHAVGFHIPWIFPLPPAPYPTDSGMTADDYPYPWTLTYQLSTFTRIPHQDRYLQMMMFRLFPQQYGHLVVPNDGTIRRADLLGVIRRDIPADQDRKRIYRSIYTIGVSSEFFLNEIMTVGQVRQVQLTIQPMEQGENYPPEVITIP